MNTSYKNRGITRLLIAVGVLYVTHVSCGRERSNSRSLTRDKGTFWHGDEAQKIDVDNISMDELYANYGIRSFEQVNETFALLTGVNPGDAAQTALRDVLAGVANQLPGSNDIKAFLAANQVGISKLATEYCDSLMNSTTLRVQAVPNFNFTAAPSAALSAASADTLYSGLMDRFWGTGLQMAADREESKVILSDLTTALLAGENQADATVTLRIAKSVCVAVLSSASVMIF